MPRGLYARAPYLVKKKITKFFERSDRKRYGERLGEPPRVLFLTRYIALFLGIARSITITTEGTALMTAWAFRALTVRTV